MSIKGQILCSTLVEKNAEIVYSPSRNSWGITHRKTKRANKKNGDVYCEATCVLLRKWEEGNSSCLGQSRKVSQRRNSLKLGCAG